MDAVLGLQRGFLTNHGNTIEQLLQCGMVLMPATASMRSGSDQVGFQEQAMYSLIEVFGLYRSFVLREARPSLVDPTPQNERLYTTCAFFLRALRSVQVLFEIDARRRGGRKAAVSLCIKIEFIKLVLKGICMRLLPFSLYVDDECVDKGVVGTEYVGRRSGMRLPGFCQAQEVAVQVRSTKDVLGEAFFHLRPFLHLLTLRSRGENWLSWMISVIPDLISLKLLHRHENASLDAAPTLPHQEIQRRRVALLWALMRSPFFDKVFKAPLVALDDVWKRIPGLNLFNIIELFLVLRPYYFSTSGT